MILVWQIFGKWPANFSTNFSRDSFGLVSPGFQAPPNSCPELSALLSHVAYLNPFFHADLLLTGEIKEIKKLACRSTSDFGTRPLPPKSTQRGIKLDRARHQNPKDPPVLL